MNTVVPFSLKSAPALIEKLLPAQKISVEAYKEQMAVSGKSLTGLGSYWKGRKPLVLNKACILGALLPATSNLKRDLEVFEMLMGMDDESFILRRGNPSPAEIVGTTPLDDLYEYFVIQYSGEIPAQSPVDLDSYQDEKGLKPSITWRKDVCPEERRKLAIKCLSNISYNNRVSDSKRPEELGETCHKHIWAAVNSHLGTSANTFPELTHQLGVMRYGRTPRVADTFSGSGQISFEAARLGCDAYASDLNPVACMLTWGAFNVVGAPLAQRSELTVSNRALANKVQAVIDALGIDSDGHGATAKAYLYCLEAQCLETGWMVPILPSLVISKRTSTIAVLVPDHVNRRYHIEIKSGVSVDALKSAQPGTLIEGALVHTHSGVTYRTNITALRGDYVDASGAARNRLRQWDISDYTTRPGDVFNERLYAIQWQKSVVVNGKPKITTEIREVSAADLQREAVVSAYVASRLSDWQATGCVPDMKIEAGAETSKPIRTRGWTHWHHLFAPRQLLVMATALQYLDANSAFGIFQSLNRFSKLSRWNSANDNVEDTFYNQALNTLYNYGVRSCSRFLKQFLEEPKSFPLAEKTVHTVTNAPANAIACENDIYITDPPFGDAVHYEEITEFFIAWLRKRQPKAFADWIWDSRRALAIKGEDDDFRRGMVEAYRNMSDHMPSNGIQILMFTHQSGSIWAEMANIIWAAGLQVTAAWYVVTETNSTLREGSYVKGTILLVLRKRQGSSKTYQGDLAWELEREVLEQVKTLTGLNQATQDLYRDENLFSDADLQMAGYAAALRVLTHYSTIDGKDMAAEAERPRVKGTVTLVDELIEYAVGVANQALAPSGLDSGHWNTLQPVERFYLKMLEMEAKGGKSLDNYQNFAKAFKVRDFTVLMSSVKANAARVKSAIEFGRLEMKDTSELHDTPLRCALYGIMELHKEVDGSDVLSHLPHVLPDFYQQRDLVAALAEYINLKTQVIRPEEASNARVLRDLIRQQRL